MQNHSHEDMEMLQGEMGNVLHYYSSFDSEKHWRMLTTNARGAHCILHKMLTDTNIMCKKLFAPFLFLEYSASTTYYDTDSTSSDSESSSDDDLL